MVSPLCLRSRPANCMFLPNHVGQVLTFWQELLGDLAIGNTKTVVGCYKLLTSLRCLAGWVITTFKEWLELKVIQPHAVSDKAEGKE